MQDSELTNTQVTATPAIGISGRHAGQIYDQLESVITRARDVEERLVALHFVLAGGLNGVESNDMLPQSQPVTRRPLLQQIGCELYVLGDILQRQKEILSSLEQAIG